MGDSANLRQATEDLISRMDATSAPTDDQFVAFADEFDPLRDQLKEATAADPHDLELEQLLSSLQASFARLSEQLSFCTLE